MAAVSRWLVRTLALLVLLGTVVGAFAWSSYTRFIATPLTLPDAGATWLVQPGTSYRAMISDLAARGWTEPGWHWRALGALDPRASRLQAGEYRLQPGVTPAELVDQLAAGRVVQHRFTIVEGWTVAELRQALAVDPVLVSTLNEVADADLMAALGLEAQHPEGWFLPETYQFPRGATDADILLRAHRAMRRVLDTVWEERDTNLPYDDPYEVLIMASIIEKETGVPAERGQIAGVFVRRLQRGMRLQTDPTVIYGLGEAYDGDIRYRDLRTDTPYNTYTRSGLPPTPIALPGRDALLAAVHPVADDTLYFVSRGDGSHQFSVTLDEHERAVDRYQRGGR